MKYLISFFVILGLAFAGWRYISNQKGLRLESQIFATGQNYYSGFINSEEEAGQARKFLKMMQYQAISAEKLRTSCRSDHSEEINKALSQLDQVGPQTAGYKDYEAKIRNYIGILISKSDCLHHVNLQGPWKQFKDFPLFDVMKNDLSLDGLKKFYFSFLQSANAGGSIAPIKKYWQSEEEYFSLPDAFHLALLTDKLDALIFPANFKGWFRRDLCQTAETYRETARELSEYNCANKVPEVQFILSKADWFQCQKPINSKEEKSQIEDPSMPWNAFKYKDLSQRCVDIWHFLASLRISETTEYGHKNNFADNLPEEYHHNFKKKLRTP